MITEQYVSFETAKLLKGKDFKVSPIYTNNYFKGNTYKNDNGELFIAGEDISVPTQSLVMRWLREVHNLVIEPYRTACGYLYTISNIPNGSTLYDNGDAYNGDDEDSGQWSTWENACEDGIKYSLNHLI